MRPARLPLLVGALALALAAMGCSEERSTRNPGGGPGGGGGGSGGSGFEETTIYDLRDPEGGPGPGATVTLRKVVVTAVVDRPDPETEEWVPQHFFVQEIEGGRRSGIYVRNGEDGAHIVPAPAVGDVVDLAGELTEYWTRLQVEVRSLKNAGPGELPAPALVDPLQVMTGGAEQEDWEGVLVEVRDVFNVEDPVVGTDGRDRGAFRVGPAGGDEGVVVGTLWPDDYRGKVGDAFASLVGVMDFSFDEARLETRGNLDITFADGSHPEPPEAVAVTIEQIQNPDAEGHPEEGMPVRVEGAVVTAFSSSGFWIQDPAGGPWSGIYVFTPGEEVEKPRRGRLVDVEGTYTEFHDLSEITVATWTDVGEGTLPEPAEVDAADLADAATAEPWEGVLVEVRDVINVEDPVLGTDGKDHGDFRVAAAEGAPGAVVGRLLGHRYAGEVGDAFQSIVGVLDYSFEAYRLQPRSNADITMADGSHPGAGAGTAFTVYEIQDPDPEDGPVAGSTVVLVEDVVVTAVERRGSFYVADPTGGPFSGIFVYVAENAGLEPPAVGDLVTVEGLYSEYFENSQIEASRIEVTGTAEVPEPMVVAPDAIATGAATAEPYEGCLVRVEEVQVTASEEFGVFRVAALDDLDPADDLIVDDDFTYAYTDVRNVGDVFESITGVVDYYRDEFRLMPRGDADLVLAE